MPILICLSTNVALAQTTEDAIFQPGPNTESLEVVVIKAPEMHEVGSVFSGSSGIETPSMDVPIQPMPPYMIPGQFSPEKVASLKKAQMAYMVRLGWIAPGVEMKMLRSSRSASEDLEFYSLSISLHQRAIKEGKKGDYYIELLKEGKTVVTYDYAARSMAQLKRDVELCGTGFALFSDASDCSRFSSQLEAEGHYHFSLKTLKERDDTIANMNSGVASLNARLAAKDKEIAALNATIKKLKRGRK